MAPATSASRFNRLPTDAPPSLDVQALDVTADTPDHGSPIPRRSPRRETPRHGLTVHAISFLHKCLIRRSALGGEAASQRQFLDVVGLRPIGVQWGWVLWVWFVAVSASPGCSPLWRMLAWPSRPPRAKRRADMGARVTATTS